MSQEFPLYLLNRDNSSLSDSVIYRLNNVYQRLLSINGFYNVEASYNDNILKIRYPDNYILNHYKENDFMYVSLKYRTSIVNTTEYISIQVHAETRKIIMYIE